MTSDVWTAILEFGVTNLAAELGISRQAVHNWRFKNRIPPERFMDLDRRLSLETDKLALAIWPDAA